MLTLKRDNNSCNLILNVHSFLIEYLEIIFKVVSLFFIIIAYDISNISFFLGTGY